ncbi:3-oxoacyl-ACP synthase III family protein [Microbacterium sp. STN6]|uniref:3-oxoacyl-ACP synthase III family protein n=1 Tax=Microbacterium sp. STN6 TaxID=2995588 RepID=UPI002260A560|nr:3-oxoacyl-ACP synthase III family protein [Microbacterium sp. STN6]MCX7521058.1 3-oxoacyl-ACP synthase III family protein [Microbacterium sp. STN6]
MTDSVWVYPLGAVLGGQPADVAELLTEHGPVRDGFLERTGFSTIYRSRDDQSSLSLALDAAVMSGSDWWKEQVDGIVSVTSTSELIAPGNAHLIQAALGLDREIFTLDVNDACTGFVRAFMVAKTLINGGLATTVLLTLADTYTKLFESSELKVSPLFSDGASALLISSIQLPDPPKSVEARRWEVLAHSFLSEGARAGELQIRRESGRDLGHLGMNGGAVFNFVLRSINACTSRLMEQSGVDLAEVDRWYVHQGSRAVVSAVEKALGVSDDLFRSAEYGNVVGSSLPFQLHADQHERSDYLLGFLAFGVGLTIGGMLVKQTSD